MILSDQLEWEKILPFLTKPGLPVLTKQMNKELLGGHHLGVAVSGGVLQNRDQMLPSCFTTIAEADRNEVMSKAGE